MRFAVLGLAAVALTACQSSSPDPQPATPAAPPPPRIGSSASLDSSVIITPPDSKVPKKYAAFSGVWVGTWDTPLDAKLAVRTIAANGAVTVTYAWGEAGDMKPGIVDGKGRIGGDRMKLERFASGVDATFTIRPDGTLMGTYTVLEQSHTGVFRKQ